MQKNPDFYKASDLVWDVLIELTQKISDKESQKHLNEALQKIQRLRVSEEEE